MQAAFVQLGKMFYPQLWGVIFGFEGCMSSPDSAPIRIVSKRATISGCRLFFWPASRIARASLDLLAYDKALKKVTQNCSISGCPSNARRNNGNASAGYSTKIYKRPRLWLASGCWASVFRIERKRSSARFRSLNLCAVMVCCKIILVSTGMFCSWLLRFHSKIGASCGLAEGIDRLKR